MAKASGRAVIDTLMATGIADENTRSVDIHVGVDGVPEIRIEKYGDPNMVSEVIEVLSHADVVRRAVSVIGGCNVQIIRATIERTPEDGWRTYEPADAGAFICDTHGVTFAGTWAEVSRAVGDHAGPAASP